MANRRPKPRLIEQTDKKYKKTQLVGLVGLVGGAVAAGLVMQFDTTDRGEGIAAAVGLVICGVGFAIWVVGSALAWWNHS